MPSSSQEIAQPRARASVQKIVEVASWIARVRVAASIAGLASLTCLAAASGCSPSKPAERPLAAYSGHVVALFDDGIEPAAVSVTGEKRAYQPKYDPLFLERAQTADGVLRVRVVTVVSKKEERGTSFVLKLRTEKKLAGANPPEEVFQVQVGPDAPSVGILRTMDSDIVGKRFVAFVRSFVRSDGDSEIHFHFAPDTKEVVEGSTDANSILEGEKTP